jgi:hypothetical protein
MSKELEGRGGYRAGTDDWMKALNSGTFFEDPHFYGDHYNDKMREAAKRAASVAGEVRDDLERNEDILFVIPRGRRETLQTVSSALSKMCRKGNQSDSDSQKIRDLLRETERSRDGDARAHEMANRQYKNSRGFDNRQIASCDYIEAIDEEVMGRNAEVDDRAGDNRYRQPIKNDLSRVARRFESDVKNGIRDGDWMRKENRKRLLEYMRMLEGAYGGRLFSFSGSDFEALWAPEERSNIFPRADIQFHASGGYDEIDSIERYCRDINKQVKAALEYNNNDQTVYIALYIGDERIFRAEYRDTVSWRSVLRNADTDVRLHEALLKFWVLTDEDIVRLNRSNWNRNLGVTGTLTEIGGTAAQWFGQNAPPNIRNFALGVTFFGQAMQASSGTFRLSRNVAEHGDFIFYYGNPDNGYGGIFCGSNYTLKE